MHGISSGLLAIHTVSALCTLCHGLLLRVGRGQIPSATRERQRRGSSEGTSLLRIGRVGCERIHLDGILELRQEIKMELSKRDVSVNREKSRDGKRKTRQKEGEAVRGGKGIQKERPQEREPQNGRNE